MLFNNKTGKILPKQINSLVANLKKLLVSMGKISKNDIFDKIQEVLPQIFSLYMTFMSNDKIDMQKIKIDVLGMIKDFILKMENEEQKWLILDIMSITIGIDMREWEAAKCTKITADLGPRDRLVVFGSQILPGVIPDLQYYISEDEINQVIKVITTLERDFMHSLKDPQKLRDIAKEICSVLAHFGIVDKELIKGVIALLNNQLDQSKDLVRALLRHKLSEEKIDQAFNYMIEARNLIVDTLGKLGMAPKAIQEGEKSSGGKKLDPENWDKILAKIKSGEANSNDLFKVVDEAGDGNGSINESEFHQLSKRLGLNLSKHRIKEIFAKVKGKASGSGEMELNEKEFEKALAYLQQKNIGQAMSMLGITPEILTAILIRLIILLLLIFVFIFLGISSFALGGTFGAVVNSLFPAAGGGGLSKSSEGDKDKMKEENIEKTTETSKEITTSEEI